MTVKARRLMQYALGIIVWLSAFAACDSRSGTSPADSAHLSDSATVLPLAPYQGRLRTVTVQIGADSFAFLFDTGGGWTLIAPELAERIACRSVGKSIGHRMSGERLEVPTCSGVTPLSIGGFAATPSTIGVFDLMKLLPADWPPLHGVVSLSTFAGHAITLDLARNQLIVETPSTLARRTAGMMPLKTRIATGDDGAAMVLFVAVRADSGELWLEFDSGNLDDVLLAPHAMHVLAGAASSDTATVDLQLIGAPGVASRTRVRPLIYDGVLNDSGFSLVVPAFPRVPECGKNPQSRPGHSAMSNLPLLSLTVHAGLAGLGAHR